MIEQSIIRELAILYITFILDFAVDKIIKDHRYNLISLIILIIGRYFAGSDFPAIKDSSLALVVITAYKSILITAGCMKAEFAYSFLSGMAVAVSFIVYYLDPKINLIRLLIKLTLNERRGESKRKSRASLENIL